MSSSLETASEPSLHPEYDDWGADMHNDDRTCKTCGGDGGHPLDDCMPCPDCDGEGYEWWN